MLIVYDCSSNNTTQHATKKRPRTCYQHFEQGFSSAAPVIRTTTPLRCRLLAFGLRRLINFIMPRVPSGSRERIVFRKSRPVEVPVCGGIRRRWDDSMGLLMEKGTAGSRPSTAIVAFRNWGVRRTNGIRIIRNTCSQRRGPPSLGGKDTMVGRKKPGSVLLLLSRLGNILTTTKSWARLGICRRAQGKPIR